MTFHDLLRQLWPYPGNRDYKPGPARAADPMPPAPAPGPEGGVVRSSPGHTPATITTLDPRACSVCGDQMPFGIAHVCWNGQDYRPERSVA